MVAPPIGLALIQFIVDSEPLRKNAFLSPPRRFRNMKIRKIHAWKTSRWGFEPTFLAHHGKWYKLSSALDHLATNDVVAPKLDSDSAPTGGNRNIAIVLIQRALNSMLVVPKPWERQIAVRLVDAHKGNVRVQELVCLLVPFRSAPAQWTATLHRTAASAHWINAFVTRRYNVPPGITNGATTWMSLGHATSSNAGFVPFVQTFPLKHSFIYRDTGADANQRAVHAEVGRVSRR